MRMYQLLLFLPLPHTLTKISTLSSSLVRLYHLLAILHRLELLFAIFDRPEDNLRLPVGSQYFFGGWPSPYIRSLHLISDSVVYEKGLKMVLSVTKCVHFLDIKGFLSI